MANVRALPKLQPAHSQKGRRPTRLHLERLEERLLLAADTDPGSGLLTHGGICSCPICSGVGLSQFQPEPAELAPTSGGGGTTSLASIAGLPQLAPYVHRRFADTVVAVKRVVLLAHAMLGSPRVLCVETPFVHLDPSSLAYVAAALEQAASGRHLVASVTSATDGERSLVERADWVVVAQGGRFVREGTPDLALEPSCRYAATVTRAADAFVAALAERGLRVTPADVAPALLGFVPENAAEVRRVLVELPSGSSPDEIVRAANRVGSPLVELAPL